MSPGAVFACSHDPVLDVLSKSELATCLLISSNPAKGFEDGTVGKAGASTVSSSPKGRNAVTGSFTAATLAIVGREGLC